MRRDAEPGQLRERRRRRCAAGRERRQHEQAAACQGAANRIHISHAVVLPCPARNSIAVFRQAHEIEDAMTETADCVVIGAGVVGLAAARALALQGREVIVLEATEAIGTETSSRNSEVIHAGIYYVPGSLKGQLCVAGKNLLYRFCNEHGVSYRNCTKLIVATSEAQHATLAAIRANALGNGVDDLAFLTGEEARALEPNLRCVGALLSPSTGIVDSHGLMLAFVGDMESRGGMIAFNSPVEGGRVVDGGVELKVGGADPMRLRCRTVVNSAGLHAQAVARSIAGIPTQSIPPTYYAKGNYFSLCAKPPFTRLIYPVPEPGGLGVHITVDLAGQARFGPDVEWVDRVEYSVDPHRADKFYAEVRRYWPDLPDNSLQPAYSGIRPKLGPAGMNSDFVIQGPGEHGVAGLVNLYGIESPGLTASLAIAAKAAQMLG
ncbi:MAG TPA: NAD(P)/FAD-dependent oxidoreductase [Alphaproteobacteria bacterium]|nr:NAD(P)/FAD-dependent oxidoreductase [Alphaproteobacteria bacterium]